MKQTRGALIGPTHFRAENLPQMELDTVGK